MPYKSIAKDRLWHRDFMRRKRSVTPVVTPSGRLGLVKTPTIDADGNIIPEY